MQLRGMGNVLEQDAGGAGDLWSTASPVLTLLNLMPFPGAGLVIGLALKVIFGNKPDKMAPHLAEKVIKPLIAAAESKDYASVIELAYKPSGDGAMPYELFVMCVSRWPQTAELFYTVMMGDAVKNNDWSRFMKFIRWIDSSYAVENSLADDESIEGRAHGD